MSKSRTQAVPSLQISNAPVIVVASSLKRPA